MAKKHKSRRRKPCAKGSAWAALPGSGRAREFAYEADDCRETEKDSSMMLLRALLSSTLIICASPAFAGDKPSAWFCWMARNAVAVAGSEAAAEQGARARGITEATIAKAKRCPR